MRKYYRRRLITVAMIAFMILLLIIIGALFVFSYLQMNNSAHSTIDLLLSSKDDGRAPFDVSAFPEMPGLSFSQRMMPSSYYDITANRNGDILSSESRGFLDSADSDIQNYVQKIASGGKEEGSISHYRYGVKENADGTVHIVLMDITIQLQMLFSMLRNALIIGAALLVLLFVILLPVTSRAAAKLARNTETQKQFITDAGHELKTPVAVIRSNLDVMELLQGKSNWSGNIRYQVDRLEALVKQLLLMARIDEKQSTGKTSVVDFSKELESEAGIYEETVLQKDLRLEKQIAGGLRTMGDQDSLKQLIHALLDNAVQYTPPQGSVRLKLEKNKHTLCLEITNSVDVLPNVEPERLMDRFTRGDTARARKNGGTGIGLSTARSIVELHKGSITVSYPDENTFRVTVHLPLCSK